jgi:hypothetical protein
MPEVSAMIESADLFLAHVGGNIHLKQVKNVKPSDELTREAFTPVGFQRPIGTILRPGAQTFELEIQPGTVEEVPYRALMRSGEVIRFTMQYKGAGKLGARIQASCQVSAYSEPDIDQGGDSTHTVTLLVLGEIKRVA